MRTRRPTVSAALLEEVQDLRDTYPDLIPPHLRLNANRREWLEYVIGQGIDAVREGLLEGEGDEDT